MALSGIKTMSVVPKAMWTGFKVMWTVARIRKRADKAAKIFEKTLRKEGIPPGMATELASIYRHAVPIPESFHGMLKS
jgi:cobalamin biosynthesis protein CbiG